MRYGLCTQLSLVRTREGQEQIANITTEHNNKENRWLLPSTRSHSAFLATTCMPFMVRFSSHALFSKNDKFLSNGPVASAPLAEGSAGRNGSLLVLKQRFSKSSVVCARSIIISGKKKEGGERF